MASVDPDTGGQVGSSKCDGLKLVSEPCRWDGMRFRSLLRRGRRGRPTLCFDRALQANVWVMGEYEFPSHFASFILYIAAAYPDMLHAMYKPCKWG